MGALQESTIAKLRETIFTWRMYCSPSASAPIGLAISLANHHTVMTDSYPTTHFGLYWINKGR